MKLSDYAKVLIVRVTINGIPGLSRLDSEETAELTAARGTTKRHARVSKTLFADSNCANELKKIAAAVRNWIRIASLPGEIDGKYMIPASHFQAIGDRLNEFQSQYTAKLREFVENLDSEIESDRQAKHNLFDSADYPTAGEIMAKAGFTWGFEPLPEGAAFSQMFDSDALAADFAERHNQHIQELFARAAEVNRERLAAKITDAITRLRRYTGEPGQRLAYNALVDGLIDAGKLAKSLNVARDPATDTLADELAQIMTELLEPETLKDSVVRQELIGKLSRIVATGPVGDVLPPLPDLSEITEDDTPDETPELSEPADNGQAHDNGQAPSNGTANVDELFQTADF